MLDDSVLPEFTAAALTPPRFYIEAKWVTIHLLVAAVLFHLFLRQQAFINAVAARRA